jgi:molecular chaperone GrpE
MAENATPEPEAHDEPTAEESAIEGDLDELVTELKRERDEYLDLAQRARADFENYRRRSAAEVAEAERRGKVSLGRAVLPALDSLERALASASIEDAVDEPNGGDSLAAGVSLVHRELVAALAAAGIESIEPTGETFDPNLHEALSSRPVEDGEASGIVAETVQRGYRAGETLVRPARVVVTA